MNTIWLRKFFRFCLAASITTSYLFPQIGSAQKIFRINQNNFPRVRQARLKHDQLIDSIFKNLDINFPPNEILILIFKNERTLELWAKSDSYDLFEKVKSYNFTAFSGNLGPKRQRGDCQIPEGFYHITSFNPVSNFHLSLGINYPNRSDRILGDQNNPGGDICIHGSAVTIGCIPIGDEAIEELYLISVDTRSAGAKQLPVYIFPCRMDSAQIATISKSFENDTTVLNFWQNIKEGYQTFQENREKLKFNIDYKGRYLFSKKTKIQYDSFPWLSSFDEKNRLMNRIDVPPGYKRIIESKGSFGNWLRHLPLKSGHPPVLLYDGTEKIYQNGHHAVFDIDVGAEDLQQCADAIIRFYAEYLFAKKSFGRINFRLTSGDLVKFRKWLSGYRPTVSGNRLSWHRSEQRDSSYVSFRNYLDFIYKYAGTYSLSNELRSIKNLKNITGGDIFIQGGFPGHAVIVIDAATDTITGQKIFLLAQSYMPAQEIHLLKNLKDSNLSPWYLLNFGDTLATPEWKFSRLDLKRFH